MYFVVKVIAGQERIAANMLQNKFGKDVNVPIYSVIIVGGMRGYIILEGEDEASVRAFITKEHNIRGILPQTLSQEEIDKLLVVKKTEQVVGKGDIIEFTSGPFKGYKAKVLRIDEQKSDMTVELMDVVVPIPITTKMNTAKIIQKNKEEQSNA
ncbi:MAG: transcription elongation factor Spt5 [Candidatus Marsarchaeota archaeon]|jgi:transcriptional antiterminator NusG|nr:transcription elongation factor Spt5 [Candidatus Marsarchaeota archaeon]